MYVIFAEHPVRIFELPCTTINKTCSQGAGSDEESSSDEETSDAEATSSTVEVGKGCAVSAQVNGLQVSARTPAQRQD